jgi:uncharacterized membrane protein
LEDLTEMEVLLGLLTVFFVFAAIVLLLLIIKTATLSMTVKEISGDLKGLKRATEQLSQLVNAREQSGRTPALIVPNTQSQPDSQTAADANVAHHGKAARKPMLHPGQAGKSASPAPLRLRPITFPTPPQPRQPAKPMALQSRPPGPPQPTAETPGRDSDSFRNLKLHLEAPAAPSPPVQTGAPGEPTSQPASYSLPPLPSRAPSIPSPKKIEWESLIGGRLLNWIGALATIIGIGFFLRYAFQNNWITPMMRVAIGLFVGASLLVGGNVSYKRGFKVFSQGLIGAGISILYLSVYASFNFYHLAPQRLAFLMMSAVTVLTLVQAFMFNSLAISILGWAGGFLTPFLLSTGESNETGLFTYIALLIAGLLAMAAFKGSWVVLQPLTLAATYLVYVLWYAKFYSPADLGTTVLFLSIFWSLFMALDVYWLRQGSDVGLDVRVVCGVFNAAFYYLALYTIIDSTRHDLTGITTLVLGAVYLGVVLALERIERDSIEFNRYLLTAIVFLVLATAFQFSGFIMVGFWSAEAALLIWCATRWKLRAVFAAAIALYGIAFIKLFSTDGWSHYGSSEQFRLLLNHRALAFTSLAAASGAGAIILGIRDKEKTKTRSALHYMWCLLGFILVTVELNDEFVHIMQGAAGDDLQSLAFEHRLILAMVWMLCSLPLVWYGIESKVLPIALSGIAILAISVTQLAISGAAYEPLSRFYPVLNARAAVFTATLVALVMHASWLRKPRQEHRWVTNVLSSVLVGWCVLLFILCTGEVRDYFRYLTISVPSGQEDVLRFRAFMALGIIWTVYGVGLSALGLKKKMMPAIICAAVAICCAVVTSIAAGFQYTPLASFVLGFNSRVLCLVSVIGGLLLIASWIRKGGQENAPGKKMYTVLAVTAALLIVYLLSVETNDYYGRELLLLTQSSSGAIPAGQEDVLTFRELMTLGIIWTVDGVGLSALGLRKKVMPFVICAAAALCCAVLTAVAAGFEYKPISSFVPVANWRVLCLVSVIAGLLVISRLVRLGGQGYDLGKKAYTALAVTVALLIVYLLSVETRDYYGRELFALAQSSSSAAVEEVKQQLSAAINRTTNLRQMALSLVWIAYSILLISFGIWRRMLSLRLVAIVLIGIAILKIFFYDLSFLETAYRIVSFIGLGLILLAISFLYQRFKLVISESGTHDYVEDRARNE